MSELFPVHEKRSSTHPQPSSEIVSESHGSSLQQMDYGELLVDQTEEFRLLFKLCVYFWQIRNKMCIQDDIEPYTTHDGWISAKSVNIVNLTD